MVQVSSTDDKTRELLNSTGFPFQHHCAEIIKGLEEFQVSMEVPFTDPPGNGPLLGVHGQIDIVAAHPDPSNTLLVCFVIECKRASEQIKNWILIPNRQQDPRWPLFIVSGTAADGTYQLSANRNISFVDLGYPDGPAFDYCINGIEMNSSLGALNRQSDEKIFKPLRQVSHATHALESANPKVVEGIDYFRQRSMSHVYVPVVLTTADIYVADFQPESVHGGDIAAGDLKLGKPKPWVSYEFPLPDHLGYSINRQDGSTAPVNKRTIFVVNDEHMKDFFLKALNVDVSTDPPAR
jgi:hypothetical protein